MSSLPVPLLFHGAAGGYYLPLKLALWNPTPGALQPMTQVNKTVSSSRRPGSPGHQPHRAECCAQRRADPPLTLLDAGVGLPQTRKGCKRWSSGWDEGGSAAPDQGPWRLLLATPRCLPGHPRPAPQCRQCRETRDDLQVGIHQRRSRHDTAADKYLGCA